LPEDVDGTFSQRIPTGLCGIILQNDHLLLNTSGHYRMKNPVRFFTYLYTCLLNSPNADYKVSTKKKGKQKKYIHTITDKTRRSFEQTIHPVQWF
jgi:hypothetical protein